MLSSDAERYEKDLNKSTQKKVRLPLKNKIDGRATQEVDGIFIRDPESLLFKVWARGDTMNSEDKRGFIFSFVNYQNKRWVISVDPEKPVYLKGLGEAIELQEHKERKLFGKPRPRFFKES